MSDITLSRAVRTNLLSLQNTASMMEQTQGRLATGKKVNSALDNPVNFFTASGLNSRAGDMSALLDDMANGIQAIEAADNGLKAITKTLESMQSTLRQARQDKSFQTESYTLVDGDPDPAVALGGLEVTFEGGSVGDTAVTVTAGAGDTLDDVVAAINSNNDLAGKVRASNDNGKLRIENQSTQELTVGGDMGASGTIDGNFIRAGLTEQYNELRDQLDKLSDDASFNGINLLRGDMLKITFNEIGTSEIEIQSRLRDSDGEFQEGVSINSGTLGIETFMAESQFDNDASIDVHLGRVKEAINAVRSQASAFGSSLSIVQNRQDFTKNMINTLQTGAANLTLADANEEAANLLALQTRQQLSSTSLSMASQADQAVLRLF